MSRGTYSTSNYLANTTYSGVLVPPLTISCWFKASSFPTDSVLRVICGVTNHQESNSNGTHLSLLILDTSIYANHRVGSTSQSSAIAYSTTDTWTHAVGVFATTNSRTLYLNGSAGTTQTGIVTAFNRTAIAAGIRFVSTGTPSAPGTYATVHHIAIWHMALAAADITSLYKKISPLLIQPNNLLYYFPLIRGDANGDEIDLLNSTKMTETGIVSVDDSPPIYFPV